MRRRFAIPTIVSSEITPEAVHLKRRDNLHLEGNLTAFEFQERIYRLRCAQAWSMVIPWVGFPLSDLLWRCEPKSQAGYVEFETLYRPDEMPGTSSFSSTIDWPYREGLRMDEAMHPLTLMAVGLCGKSMPNQNGAPIL